MATNNNGHLIDDKGNVVVDFVWGNLPLQPNDDRTALLDFSLDNHVIAESGWNGYPLYTPNDDGEFVGGTAFIVVPSVLGLTTALAVDALKDAGYVNGNITSTTGVTNTAVAITRINVTTTTAATVYATGGTSAFPVGTKVAIGAGTGIPTALVGTWTVTGGNGSTIIISGTGWTVADTGSITPAASLTGKTGTVKTQSVAAGADSIALGTTITITSWA